MAFWRLGIMLIIRSEVCRNLGCNAEHHKDGGNSIFSERASHMTPDTTGGLSSAYWI